MVFTLCLECHNGAGNFGGFGPTLKAGDLQSAVRPQHGGSALPELHHLPRADPRVEHQRVFLPVTRLHENISTHSRFRALARASRSRRSRPPPARPSATRAATISKTTTSRRSSNSATASRPSAATQTCIAAPSITSTASGCCPAPCSFNPRRPRNLFDQICAQHPGPGQRSVSNPPILRIEKNGLYRYDMVWRQNAYFDPALTVSFGEHLMNTTRTMQDHDLTLFPQSKFKILPRLFAQRRRPAPRSPPSSCSTPAATSIRFSPMFIDQQNEYRLGGEAQFLGFPSKRDARLGRLQRGYADRYHGARTRQ